MKDPTSLQGMSTYSSVKGSKGVHSVESMHVDNSRVNTKLIARGREGGRGWT